MWYFAQKYRLFRVKRKLVVYGAFFLSMWFGYIYSGLGKNLYTLGYY
jgi:hypothetical protein